MFVATHRADDCSHESWLRTTTLALGKKAPVSVGKYDLPFRPSALQRAVYLSWAQPLGFRSCAALCTVLQRQKSAARSPTTSCAVCEQQKCFVDKGRMKGERCVLARHAAASRRGCRLCSCSWYRPECVDARANAVSAAVNVSIPGVARALAVAPRGRGPY